MARGSAWWTPQMPHMTSDPRGRSAGHTRSDARDVLGADAVDDLGRRAQRHARERGPAVPGECGDRSDDRRGLGDARRRARDLEPRAVTELPVQDTARGAGPHAAAAAAEHRTDVLGFEIGNGGDVVPRGAGEHLRHGILAAALEREVALSDPVPAVAAERLDPARDGVASGPLRDALPRDRLHDDTARDAEPRLTR